MGTLKKRSATFFPLFTFLTFSSLQTGQEVDAAFLNGTEFVFKGDLACTSSVRGRPAAGQLSGGGSALSRRLPYKDSFSKSEERKGKESAANQFKSVGPA